MKFTLLCWLFALTGSALAGYPNIVLILVDDMGYGDPGCFNADSKIRTPHIDGLARDGMRFTDAHAPGPLCHMSRYGLITGRYPFRTNVGLWRKKPLIDKGQVTIASLLKQQGYQTAMVGKWHLGFDESSGYERPMPGGPVDVGFDSYFGIRASTDIPPYFYIRGNKAVAPPTKQIGDNRSPEPWNQIQGAFWRKGGIAPGLKLEEVTPRFTEEAIRVIEKRDPEKPLLLYLAYPSPHTPWLPSKEFEGKSKAGLYGDFMEMVDAEIGQVLGALNQADMDKDTLVIFTSDNGPVWYDKDTERLGHDSAGPLRGMKADAWEAGHRMPFVLRWPGKATPGSTSARLLCFTDFLATFAQITGATLPRAAGPDSFSFVSAITGAKDRVPLRESIVMQAGGGAKLYRESDGWKLIDRLGSSGFSKPNKIKPEKGGPSGQLYHLGEDLAEQKNRWIGEPERVKRMSAELKRIVDAGRHRR